MLNYFLRCKMSSLKKVVPMNLNNGKKLLFLHEVSVI